MKKVIKRITAVVTVLCLLCAGLFYLYVNDYYHADEKVQEYMASDDRVTVLQEDGWISFETALADTGIIFYPGAKVEAISYAPLMRGLQKKESMPFLYRCRLTLPFLESAVQIGSFMMGFRTGTFAGTLLVEAWQPPMWKERKILMG